MVQHHQAQQFQQPCASYFYGGGGGGGGRNAYFGDRACAKSGSNRSRTESGSSTESSKGSRGSIDGSGGSGVANNDKPRRRSHRPRGCRGGSNKRKHILQQQQQQQQQKTMMVHQDRHLRRYPQHNNHDGFLKQNRPDHSLQVRPDYNTARRQQDHHRNHSNASYDFSHHLSSGETRSSTVQVEIDRPRDHDNTSRFLDDHRHYELHHQSEFRNRESSSSSFIHRTLCNGNGSHLGVQFSLRRPYYDAPATNVSEAYTYNTRNDEMTNETSTFDDSFLVETTTGIQRSYSDTSSSGSDRGSSFSSNNKQKDYLYGDDASLFPPGPVITDSNSYNNQNVSDLYTNFSVLPNWELDDNEQILPPLPSDVFEPHQPIPSGPNPYALKNSSHLHKSSDAVDMCTATRPSSSLDRVLQPRQSDNNMPLKIETTLDDDSKLKTDGLPLKASMGQGHYRKELVQNQQNMPEGGSLFVTSPRSFLMGVRKTNSHSSTTMIRGHCMVGLPMTNLERLTGLNCLSA